MYFQYGEAETTYLSARDERMAAVIAQVGHIEREVDTDLFRRWYTTSSASRSPRKRRRPSGSGCG